MGRPIRRAGLVALAAITFAACGPTAPSGSRQSSPRPSTAACTNDELRGSLSGPFGADSNTTVNLTVTNVGGSTCNLQGLPHVRAFDSEGTELPNSPVRAAKGLSFDRRVLNLDGSATFSVTWLGANQGSACQSNHVANLARFTVDVGKGQPLVVETGSIAPNLQGVCWVDAIEITSVSVPTVTVSPAEGLAGSQVVQVSLTGFGSDQKVWLSECRSARDVSWAGCGPGLPVQPFLITDVWGASSPSPFTVDAMAHESAGSSTTSSRCTHQCVLVATAGNNGSEDLGIAYAVISFGNR